MGDRKRRHISVREEVRHALIALVASEPEGVHAYELDRRLRVLSEGFWAPYSGELSRTLHQLEGEGDISSAWQMEHGRPKRVFTAARHGVERVDAWLHAEITGHPRPLRDTLWHRFVAHRARRRAPSELLRDIHIRRTASLEHLRRLEERLTEIAGTQPYATFTRLAVRIRQLEWQAELGILDEIERELARDGKSDATDCIDVPTNGEIELIAPLDESSEGRNRVTQRRARARAARARGERALA